MKLIFNYILFLSLALISLVGKAESDSTYVFELGEITVFHEYPFKSDAERIEYLQLEKDMRKVYPLVLIVEKEYKRVNEEMELYDKKRRREYLKWYENYVREHYMPLLSGMTVSQGRLFLKLIDRETGQSPYRLIKTYRNGFRAIFWQGAAFLFNANLKTSYKPEDNPMVEDILKRIKAENHTLTGQTSMSMDTF